jgi:hypothetical protein
LFHHRKGADWAVIWVIEKLLLAGLDVIIHPALSGIIKYDAHGVVARWYNISPIIGVHNIVCGL